MNAELALSVKCGTCALCAVRCTAFATHARLLNLSCRNAHLYFFAVRSHCAWASALHLRYPQFFGWVLNAPPKGGARVGHAEGPSASREQDVWERAIRNSIWWWWWWSAGSSIQLLYVWAIRKKTQLPKGEDTLCRTTCDEQTCCV